MNRFKQDYLNAASPSVRLDIICGEILVALFKKWDKEVPGGRSCIDKEHVSKVSIAL